MKPETRGRKDLWPIALIFAGALLRLSSVRAVFRGGNIFFVDADDYYHLRRMMTAAANFPRLPSFDAYLGFPKGFHCNWPPLYDWFCGWLMMGANLRTSEIIAAFVPPVAGTLTLWLFWRVCTRVLERRAALCALGLAAVLPMPALYTLAGRPDHHCVENIFFLSVLTVILDQIKRDKESALRDVIIAAAALAAGIACWLGSIVFAGILFVFAARELLPRRTPPIFLIAIMEVLAFASGFLFPFRLSHWGTMLTYDFDAPSSFQPAVLIVLSCSLGAAYCYRARENKRVMLLCAAAAVWILGYLAHKSVSSWALFSGAPLPVFAAASEMQPLLKPGGAWSGENAGAFFGWALWLLPWLAWRFYKDDRTAGRRLVLVWAAVTGLLALWQTRYAYHFTFAAASLLGFGLDALVGKFRREWKSSSTAWAAALSAVGLVLWHPLMNSAGIVMTDADQLTVDADLVETADWLRERTPPTSSLWGGEKAPEYGVYALHDHGAVIAAVGQRPAAAADMHVMRSQILESSALFLMDSESQAYDFLRERRFRYVVLGDIYHDGVLAMEAKAINAQGVLSRLWDLVYMRLYVNDGSLSSNGRQVVAPVGHMRLVHESPRESFGVRRFKVFEVVPGASLSGRCSGVVQASVPVRTDQGRDFVYRTFSPCEGEKYAMNLPYPGRYEISEGKRKDALDISDSDVENGVSRRKFD